MIRSLIYRLFRVRITAEPATKPEEKEPVKTPPLKTADTPGENSSDDHLDKSIVKRQRERARAVQKEKKRLRELQRQEKTIRLNVIIGQLVKRTVKAIDEASQDGKTSVWVLIDTAYSEDDSNYGIPDLRSFHMVRFLERLKHLGYDVTQQYDDDSSTDGGSYNITREKVRKRSFPTGSRAGPVEKGDAIARWIYYRVSIPDV